MFSGYFAYLSTIRIRHNFHLPTLITTIIASYKELLPALAEVYKTPIKASDLRKVVASKNNLSLYSSAPQIKCIHFTKSDQDYKIPVISHSLTDIRQLHQETGESSEENITIDSSIYDLCTPLTSFLSTLEPQSPKKIVDNQSPPQESTSPVLLPEVITDIESTRPNSQESTPSFSRGIGSRRSWASTSEQCFALSTTPRSSLNRNSDQSANNTSLPSSTDTFISEMATGNRIDDEEVFHTGGRTPLLDHIYISALTSNYGPYRKLILTSIDDEWFKTPVGAYDDKMIIAANAICEERLNMLDAYTAARHSTLMTGELGASFLPASISCQRLMLMQNF